MKNLMLISLCSVYLFIGCSEEEGAVSTPPDPAESYKLFVPQFLSVFQLEVTKWWNESGEFLSGTTILKKDRPKPNKIFTEEAKYDIRKTDSLINPYDATIEYKVHEYVQKYDDREPPQPSHIHVNKSKWRIHFAWDKGKWIPKTLHDLSDYSDDSELGYMVERVREIKPDKTPGIWAAFQKVKQ